MTTQGTAQEFKKLLDNKEEWNVLEQVRLANEWNPITDNSEIDFPENYNMSFFSFTQEHKSSAALSIVLFMDYIYGKYSLHINSMTKETIHSIIDKTTESFESSFIKSRKTFFLKTEMTEKDYNDNRISYLVENQQEPTKVYTMEEFDYICEKVLGLFRALSLEFFKGNKIKVSVAEHFLNQYYCDMSKRFNTVHESIIDEMWKHFIKKMEKNTLQEQDILNYQSNKVCILTHFLYSTDDFLAKAPVFQKFPIIDVAALDFQPTSNEQTEMNKYVEGLTSYFDVYINHWDLLKTLLTKENKEITLAYLTSFMTALLPLVNKLSEKNSILGYNFLLNAKSFMEERTKEYEGAQVVKTFVNKIIPHENASKDFDDFLIHKS